MNVVRTHSLQNGAVQSFIQSSYKQSGNTSLQDVCVSPSNFIPGATIQLNRKRALRYRIIDLKQTLNQTVYFPCISF